MKRLISCFSILLILCTYCFADPITIDGDFSDWSDKPGISKTAEDALPEIITDAPPANTAEGTGTPASQPDNPVPSEQSPTAESPSGTTTSPLAGTPPEIAGQDSPQVQITSEPAAPQTVITEEATLQTAEESAKSERKYNIEQLKWSMSDTSDTLYIMLKLAHKDNQAGTSITTEIVTDYGTFLATTTYNLSDSSVMTSVSGKDIETTEGSCRRINKSSVYLEYGIPVSSLLEDMKWGYQLRFRVSTPDDTKPTNKYIIVSTASTMPYLGILLSAFLCIILPYLKKKRRGAA